METASALPEELGVVTVNRENGEVGGGSEEDEKGKSEEGDRYYLGNRWPQQETLALLKIRSEMDSAFKDTNLKAHLWEEVSRKLGELGFSRSAKKCKEKFENIYKYHRRTKDGRSGRPNGKNYRFFEQLEALENSNGLISSPSPDKVQPYSAAAAVTPVSFVPNAFRSSGHNSPVLNSVDTTSTSTASTSSQESEGTRKKKRKMADFIGKLMQQVIDKQESWQRKFLEAIEKCEQERIAREEAWKLQELERIKRERELLVQERSIAAAKDAAVLAFLQKFSEQASPGQLSEIQELSVQLPEQSRSVPVQFPHNPIIPVENQIVPADKVVRTREISSVENFGSAGSSRWPKEEIEALIRLRSNLDLQYQKDGPKGPLWEEISVGMKKLGYDRSAKRCKEKWENMNKYFRRVKESNKKRPDDSKTCPYFNQLDALYKEKLSKHPDNSVNPAADLKPEELLMHMMGGQGQREQLESATTEDGESENVDRNQETDTEKENGDHYRIVANDVSSVPLME